MAKASVFLCLTIIAFGVVVNGSFQSESESKSGTPPIVFHELKKGSMSINVTNYGARIVMLYVPDKYGKVADVVLGYDSIHEYMTDAAYFGAIAGRVANRIANAQFKLNGHTYKLLANEGKNMLHGGPKGFSSVIWEVAQYQPNDKNPNVVLKYHSRDGEEGFPGDLDVSVTFSLTGKNGENELTIKMNAKAKDKATPVNLAEHAYWNLGGHDSGDILSDDFQIFGSHITPVDSELIPTGQIQDIKGTPYDFLQSKAIRSQINKEPGLFDINYVLDGGKARKLRQAARVHNKKTGREMELWTNQPGLQFFTGQNTNNITGKGGYIYKIHAGLALETQGFPDSVNHPNFPSQIVNPGETYKHYMRYKFSIKEAKD